jgi:transcriptional regulator with XRE-family HTH domain
MNGIGKLMRILRDMNGESLDDLAEVCGFTRQGISNLELGKTIAPRIDIALRVANHYGMSLDDFAKAGTLLHYHGGEEILRQSIRLSAGKAIKEFADSFDFGVSDFIDESVSI